MASTKIQAELQIKLEENATASAPRVAAALEKVQRQSEALQAALARSSLPDKLQADLAKLRVSASTVDAAALSWNDYAKARGLAGKSSVDWSKADAAAVKQFAATALEAEKAVAKEEAAHARARHQAQQEALKEAKSQAAAAQHLRDEAAREAARSARELAAEEMRIARETTRELQREERERTRLMEREERERHRALEQQREAIAKNGFGHFVVTGAAAAVSAHGVVRASEVSVEKGAELQETRALMEKAGIDAATRKAIEDQAIELSAKYGNVSQIAIMELAKEARSVLKDQAEVAPTTAILAAAKSALDASDKTGGSSEGLGMLVKGAESIGAAQDPARLAKLIDAYVKAIEVMGHTINPEQIYQFDKYLKAEGARVSDRFLMTTGLSLAQEMGGSTAGKDIAQTSKDIVGGFQNKHVPLKEAVRIGLIDRRDVEWVGGKNGKLEAKGIKAGHKGIKDADLAASDLDLWVYKDLLPALERTKGIGKDRVKQLDWVTKVFTGTEADVISKLITQRESFENHAKLYAQAKDLSENAQINHQLAAVGFDAMTKALGNLEAQATSPLMGMAGKALFSIADGLNWLAIKAKDHPIAGATGAVVAGGLGLAGSGYFAYKMLNGFGLGTSATALGGSATALDGSAAALSEAAAALTAAAAKEGVSAAAGAVTAAEGAGAATAAGAGALGVGAIALPALAATGLGAYMADHEFGTLDPKKFTDTPENRKATQNIDALPGVDDDDDAPTPLAGARAAGGPVGAGRTYLVGEHGPELFTAGASGQITSHERLMGALRDPATLTTGDVQRVLASATGSSRMDAETAKAVREFGFDLSRAVDNVADSVDRLDGRALWGRPGDAGSDQAGGGGATPYVAGGSGRGSGGSSGPGAGRGGSDGASPDAATASPSSMARAGLTDRPVESGLDAFNLYGAKHRGEGIRPIDPNAFIGGSGGTGPEAVAPFRAGGKTKGDATFDAKSPQVMARLQRDFGLDKESAAAILGNLGHESAGFNAFKEGGNGPGRGWAQWTSRDRKKNFYNYVARNHLDPKSDEANYGFLRWELTHTNYRRAIDAVKRAHGLQGKVEAFERAFEGAGVKAYGSRMRYAERAMSRGADAQAPDDNPSSVGAFGVGGFNMPRRPALDGATPSEGPTSAPATPREGPSAPPAVADAPTASPRAGEVVGDLSAGSTYPRKGENIDYKALVVHHTGMRGTPQQVEDVLNKRGLGVQYTMDRDGTLTRLLPEGSRAAHILKSEVKGLPLSNDNTEGVEVIAKDDSDVTPAQIAGMKKFYADQKKLHPGLEIYGHGYLNPSHKQATEGKTIVDAIRKSEGLGPLNARDPVEVARAAAKDVPVAQRGFLGAYAGRDPAKPRADPLGVRGTGGDQAPHDVHAALGALHGGRIAPAVDNSHLEHTAALLDKIHGKMKDIHSMSASAQRGGGPMRVGALNARTRGGFASAGSSFG